MVNISVNFIIVYCVKLFLSLLMLYGLTYKASHLFHDRRSCMLPAPVPVQCLLGRLVRHPDTCSGSMLNRVTHFLTKAAAARFEAHPSLPT